jgi:hypothetical protein
MAHEVKLEVFEGPIDLLLHLITRRRVDIYEVSLASITENYLAGGEGAGSSDPDPAPTLREPQSRLGHRLPGSGRDPARAQVGAPTAGSVG